MIHRFILIGLLAMAVHFACASIAIRLGLPPLIANLMGFLLAFPVSYLGHRGWTFKREGLSHSSTIPRFLAVSLAGFTANEISYAAILSFMPLHETVGLALVLGGVAASTFVICRLWAFMPPLS